MRLDKPIFGILYQFFNHDLPNVKEADFMKFKP